MDLGTVGKEVTTNTMMEGIGLVRRLDGTQRRKEVSRKDAVPRILLPVETLATHGK